MHERWIDVDGIFVHAAEWQPSARSESQPILLVHGLGGSTASWWPVAQPIADRLATTVVAVDLAGFGRTRPDGRPATIRTNGELVAALLARHGGGIVVGNSMGGAIGVGVAARYPDLVHALVLVDAAFPRPRGSAEQLVRAARFAAMTVPRVGAPLVAVRARTLGPEGLVDATMRIVLAHPERLDPDMRERLVAIAAERADYPEAAASYTTAAGSLFRYLTRGMRDDLAAVQAPTLVVHGAADRLVPVSFARAVAARRPDWTLAIFDDCGHTPQLELPARFIDTVVDWLPRVLGATGHVA